MCLHATKDEINAPASESIQPLLGCKGRNCSKVQVNQNHLDTIQTLQKVKACIRAVSKTNVHQMGHAQALASSLCSFVAWQNRQCSERAPEHVRFSCAS